MSAVRSIVNGANEVGSALAPRMSPDAAPQGMTDPGTVQHPMHALIAPISAAPPDIDPMVQYEQGLSATPTKQRMSLGGENEPGKVIRMSPMDQQEESARNRMSRDIAKDENPWGTPDNHPGFFGKLGHLGSQFIQNIQHEQGQLTPREAEEQRLGKEIQGIESEKSKEGLEGAQAGLAGANTEHVQAETPEVAPNAESTRGLQAAETAEKEAAIASPSLATAYSHAVNESLKAGRDPATDPVVQHLSDAITSIQKQTAPKGAHFIQREVGGKPHTIAVDDLTGADIRDEGETGEKPPTVNVNAGLTALDREATRLAKPYEKGISDANAQLDKIADARNMVNGNAESQALGVPKVLTALVSGQGSGVRITQPELNAIAKARGISGDVEGTLNKWAGQGALTPIQQQQLTHILDDVRNRILQKQAIHSAALDAINGGASRDDVIKADKEARQKLNALESGSGSQQTIVQHSPSTGQYRYSTDGGKTWQPGQPKQ